MAVCENSIIGAEDIELNAAGRPLAAGESASFGTLKEQMEHAEEQAIRRALERTGGDRHQAMELLGLKKSSFYDRLQHYGIK